MSDTIVCPTCGGTGRFTEDVQPGAAGLIRCPDCANGRQPSPEVLERMADAIADLPYDTLELRNWGEEGIADPYPIIALAAWLAEHEEDSDE